MLKNQWSKKEIEDSEYEIHHRALSEEYSFFEAVKDGNIEAIVKLQNGFDKKKPMKGKKQIFT